MTDTIYDTITAKIVAAIESGAGQWRMPWHSRPGEHGVIPSVQPVSISTGKRYRGMNTVLLWVAAQEKGYDSALWGTFKAWKERGGSVNKGEKATQVVFWKQLNVNVTNPTTGEITSQKRLFARGYYVFNVAQQTGYAPKIKPVVPVAEPVDAPEIERLDFAETFFSALPCDVRHGGNQAYCSRATGHIQLPAFDQFDSPEDYYSTRGHESVHWSGHPGRLDRTFGKRFGDEAYAFEELVAELGAAFLCGHLGISNEPRPDHAAYLQSWLRVLKNDHRAIFTAASKAQAATDYLVELAGGVGATNADDESELDLAA